MPEGDGPDIRQVQQRDYRAVAQMHLAAWKKAYLGILSPECLNAHVFAGFTLGYVMLSGKGYTVTAAFQGDDPVGIAIYHPKLGELDSLYAEPRREGVGTRLLEFALAAIEVDKVTLECAQGNGDGLGYWESQGFVRNGTGEAFQPDCDGAPEVPTWRYVLNRSKTTSKTVDHS